DLLVNGESVRVVGNRVEQHIERLPMVSLVDQVLREGKPGAPVLRILRDELLTEIDEAPRSAELGVRALQAIECEMRPVRHGLREGLPGFNGRSEVPLLLTNVAQVQVR